MFTFSTLLKGEYEVNRLPPLITTALHKDEKHSFTTDNSFVSHRVLNENLHSREPRKNSWDVTIFLTEYSSGRAVKYVKFGHFFSDFSYFLRNLIWFTGRNYGLWLRLLRILYRNIRWVENRSHVNIGKIVYGSVKKNVQQFRKNCPNTIFWGNARGSNPPALSEWFRFKKKIFVENDASLKCRISLVFFFTLFWQMLSGIFCFCNDPIRPYVRVCVAYLRLRGVDVKKIEILSSL